MIKLTFECISTEAVPYTVRGDWLQITYEQIRDTNDVEIAAYYDGFWQVIGNQKQYSDIILSSDS